VGLHSCEPSITLEKNEEADIKTIQIDNVETDNIECLNIDVAENLINGEVTYSKIKGTTNQVLTLIDNDGKTEYIHIKFSFEYITW